MSAVSPRSGAGRHHRDELEIEQVQCCDRVTGRRTGDQAEVDLAGAHLLDHHHAAGRIADVQLHAGSELAHLAEDADQRVQWPRPCW